jgi:hypothetical protein
MRCIIAVCGGEIKGLCANENWLRFHIAAFGENISSAHVAYISTHREEARRVHTHAVRKIFDACNRVSKYKLVDIVGKLGWKTKERSGSSGTNTRKFALAMLLQALLKLFTL